jgi:c-di-GMP-binding flagellar brake protein YcgR
MRKKKKIEPPKREKRKDSRVNEEDKVVIEVLSNSNHSDEVRIFSALTRDISPGGMRIMANRELTPGTQVRLEVALPRSRKLIRGRGKISWTRSVYEEKLFEMGVEFTQIPLKDKMILLEHTYRKRE